MKVLLQKLDLLLPHSESQERTSCVEKDKFAHQKHLNGKHVCRLCVAIAVVCLTLSMSRQSFGALSEFNWIIDNPEGAACTFGVWPITGGQQDFTQDPIFGPQISLSPSGFWGFPSFTVNETLEEPITVTVNGVLSRVGSSVPGPNEIPFSFDFSTETPGIMDNPVYFPITPVPPGVISLTFAAIMTTEDPFHEGLTYGMGMGVGIIPEPATICLLGFGGLALVRRRRR